MQPAMVEMNYLFMIQYNKYNSHPWIAAIFLQTRCLSYF